MPRLFRVTETELQRTLLEVSGDITPTCIFGTNNLCTFLPAYAMYNGYVCTGMLLQDLALQVTESNGRQAECNSSSIPTSSQSVPGYGRISEMFFEKRFDDSRVIHGYKPNSCDTLCACEQVCLLKVVRGKTVTFCSGDAIEMHKGGLLIASAADEESSSSDESNQDRYCWEGIHRWFLSVRSTSLFHCHTVTKTPITVQVVRLVGSTVKLLYIPPTSMLQHKAIETPDTPSFKQWIAQSFESFTKAGDKLAARRDHRRGWFVRDYADANFVPEVMTSGTLEGLHDIYPLYLKTLKAGIHRGPGATSFLAMARIAHDMWKAVHPSSALREEIIQRKIMQRSHMQWRFRHGSSKVTRAILLIQRRWIQKILHPVIYVPKLKRILREANACRLNGTWCIPENESGCSQGEAHQEKKRRILQ